MQPFCGLGPRPGGGAGCGLGSVQGVPLKANTPGKYLGGFFLFVCFSFEPPVSRPHLPDLCMTHVLSIRSSTTIPLRKRTFLTTLLFFMPPPYFIFPAVHVIIRNYSNLLIGGWFTCLLFIFHYWNLSSMRALSFFVHCWISRVENHVWWMNEWLIEWTNEGMSEFEFTHHWTHSPVETDFWIFSGR